MELSLIISGLALTLTLFNALTIRVVKNTSSEVAHSVSVLIPMRNEEENVTDCINSIIAKTNLVALFFCRIMSIKTKIANGIL